MNHNIPNPYGYTPYNGNPHLAPTHLSGPGMPGVAPNLKGHTTAAGYAQSMSPGQGYPAGGSQHWGTPYQQQPPSLGVYGHPNYPRATGVGSGAPASGSRFPLSHVRGPSARPARQSSPQDAARKLAAAQIIVDAFRATTANNVHRKMVHNGYEWHGNTGEDGAPLPLKELSNDNLGELRTALSETPLRSHEKKFIDDFLKTPMFITHATHANVIDPQGSAVLFSRQKMVERGMSFPSKNTSQDDIKGLGNDDNVFFSLEVGERPRKPSSRFGDSLLRFEFDRPDINQHALMFLSDPYNLPLAPEEGRFKTLDELPPEQRKYICDTLENRYGDATGLVYHGKDMKIGLAFAIVRECRNMSPEVSKKMLTREDPNALINSLFRPQIMVPRHFFGRPHDVTPIRKIER